MSYIYICMLSNIYITIQGKVKIYIISQMQKPRMIVMNLLQSLINTKISIYTGNHIFSFLPSALLCEVTFMLPLIFVLLTDQLSGIFRP
jgi:hypothetical protein